MGSLTLQLCFTATALFFCREKLFTITEDLACSSDTSSAERYTMYCAVAHTRKQLRCLIRLMKIVVDRLMSFNSTNKAKTGAEVVGPVSNNYGKSFTCFYRLAPNVFRSQTKL